MVFDHQNRKLAMCNTQTGDYRVYDFEYVLKWHYEWRTGMQTDVGITGARSVRER